MSKKNATEADAAPERAGDEAIDAIHRVDGTVPSSVPLTKREANALRAAERRAPPHLIALVVAEAEENGGQVGGVPIDPAGMRADAARVASLRVAASTARSIARRLDQEALTLAASVAQRALSATTSLQAFARTPAGRTSSEKAAELRAAARESKPRKPRTTRGAAKATDENGSPLTA
jgi:hypothetical protein